jgi:hypothetical protein
MGCEFVLARASQDSSSSSGSSDRFDLDTRKEIEERQQKARTEIIQREVNKAAAEGRPLDRDAVKKMVVREEKKILMREERNDDAKTMGFVAAMLTSFVALPLGAMAGPPGLIAAGGTIIAAYRGGKRVAQATHLAEALSKK